MCALARSGYVAAMVKKPWVNRVSHTEAGTCLGTGFGDGFVGFSRCSDGTAAPRVVSLDNSPACPGLPSRAPTGVRDSVRAGMATNVYVDAFNLYDG